MHQPSPTTPLLLLGAPGTGKTHQLLTLARTYLDSGADPSRLLVLTPSRISATRFRETLAASTQATLSASPVRAWQAYAFDLLRRAHIAGYLPGIEFSPKLLSGPEQDVLLKELLDGHRAGRGTKLVWPQDLQEALDTRGFRHEIRDFFDRLAEYDLNAPALRDLARIHNRPEWEALATLYTEYRQIRALRAPHAYDPAALIHEAVRVLLKNPDYLAAERSRYDLILIDDAQELTPSIYRLLSALAAHNPEDTLGRSHSTAQDFTPQQLEALATAYSTRSALAVSCCTDTVVQGFRGAQAQMAAQLPRILGGAHTQQLTTSYRMGPDLAQRWAALADRLPLIPGASHPRTLQIAPREEASVQALIPLGDDGALLDPEKARDEAGAVLGLTVESPQHESRLLAQMILEDHLYRGRAYSRSAVIVRNGADVARLKRSFSSLGIPVATAASMTPVRDEPAVRPFLDALGLILHGRKMRSQEEALAALEAQEQENQATEEQQEAGTTEPTPASPYTAAPGARWGLGVDTAISLLTSRLGGASTLEVRRLRQRLRADELRAGGGRDSDTLLVEALMNPHLLPASGAGAAARRLGKVLTAGDQALDVPGATAETVLWALWEASGLASTWEEASRGVGSTADRANRDIDAMIGLFEAAARYTDQMPGATAAQFLDYIDSQDLPMDTLAQRTSERDAVEILTPALAAGREWDIVYVAGIQDGTWPNTKIRGSLLGTQDLIDTLTAGTNPQHQPGSLGERMRQTRFDEIRMFSVAVSRARYRTVCTAVASTDQAPSELLDIYAPAPGGERTNTEVRRPMTLRSLIAELRQWAESYQVAPEKADAAARLLHRLGDRDQTAGLALPGVAPESWWGLLPLSSGGASFPEDEPVPVSPSQIEAIHRSPLDWFVAAARAEAATDLSRSLGTLIHSICEDLPDAPGHELRDELDRRLPSLGLPDTWESHKTVERAREMIGRFAQYVAELPGKNRQLVGVEGSFTVLVPGPARDALVRGRVDRVEVDATGRYIIIDVKTGKSKPTKADMVQHPQLATYQVALEAGAGQAMARALGEKPQAGGQGQPKQGRGSEPLTFRGLQELSGGALLLQIGGSTASYSEQDQAPLGLESTWAVELITRAAELIAGDRFQARHAGSTAFGVSCLLPDICPLCARGRQVTVRRPLAPPTAPSAAQPHDAQENHESR